jgi:hypothetical protein
MKRIIITFSIYFLILFSLIAQAPYAFNYQGVASDASGKAIAEKKIALRISLVQSSDEGSIVFSEEHEVTTTAKGLFSLRIGNGFPVLGNLRTIDWGEDLFYIRVEMDPEGGSDFTELGTSQLYSVPYALYSASSGSSGGNSSDNQRLALSGSNLSIENGNTVDLSILQDGVTDADSDPTNEYQSLSLNQNQLSISNGNTITLPMTNSSSDVWNRLDDNSANFIGKTLYIQTPEDEFSTVDLGSTFESESGYLNLWINDPGANLSGSFLSGEEGLTGQNVDFDLTYFLGHNNDGSGSLDLFDNGENRISAGLLGNRAGFLATYGPNNKLNIFLSTLANYENNGFIGVQNAQGETQAGLYVDNNGQGVIFADTYNNIIDYPDKSGRKAIYSSLQGPEHAVYTRGTQQLINGQAEIQLPSHMSAQMTEAGLTVMVVPLSEESKGLAVVKKSVHGFVVKELFSGTGNYSFDWEIKGIRKSIHPSSENPLIASEIEEKEASKNLIKSRND